MPRAAPSFVDKLQDAIVPASLGAMIYFLQLIAHDNNELSKNVAVMARRQDDCERRLDSIEAQRRVPRSGPR